MSEHNGHRATPADKIRKLMTKIVLLPERTALAGEPVGVRIRILGRRERNEIYGGLPTFRMSLEEMIRYVESMDGAARVDYQRLSDEADEQFLRLAVVEPKIAAERSSLEESTIPIEAVWPDRLHLIQEVLRFSGLLARPPEPEEPRPAALPPVKEDLPEEAFRAPMGASPGDGGVVAAPGVGAAEENAC